LTLAGENSVERDGIGPLVHPGAERQRPPRRCQEITQLAGVEPDLPSRSASLGQMIPCSISPPAYSGNPQSSPCRLYSTRVRRLFRRFGARQARSDCAGLACCCRRHRFVFDRRGGASFAGDLEAPQLLSSVSDDARFDETAHIQHDGAVSKQEAQKIVLRTSASTLVDDLSMLKVINDQPVAGSRRSATID